MVSKAKDKSLPKGNAFCFVSERTQRAKSKFQMELDKSEMATVSLRLMSSVCDLSGARSGPQVSPQLVKLAHPGR